MVPGVFRQVTPYFIARPLLGRICASKPWGSSINKPVGIKTLSSGLMVTVSLRSALRSIPEESAVAYSGRALLDLFMILTLINDMRTKISDKAQVTRFKTQDLDQRSAIGNRQ